MLKSRWRKNYTQNERQKRESEQLQLLQRNGYGGKLLQGSDCVCLYSYLPECLCKYPWIYTLSVCLCACLNVNMLLLHCAEHWTLNMHMRVSSLFRHLHATFWALMWTCSHVCMRECVMWMCVLFILNYKHVTRLNMMHSGRNPSGRWGTKVFRQICREKEREGGGE